MDVTILNIPFKQLYICLKSFQRLGHKKCIRPEVNSDVRIPDQKANTGQCERFFGRHTHYPNTLNEYLIYLPTYLDASNKMFLNNSSHERSPCQALLYFIRVIQKKALNITRYIVIRLTESLNGDYFVRAIGIQNDFWYF